jgi:hypothetical protein
MTHVSRALGSEQWRKPWSGSSSGNCVEAKKLGDDNAALRQSTDPTDPPSSDRPATSVPSSPPPMKARRTSSSPDPFPSGKFSTLHPMNYAKDKG